MSAPMNRDGLFGRLGALVPVFVLALALTACGGSKEPAYYALAARSASPHAGAPPLIELRRPGIAGYLDRADIVKRVAGYRLDVDSDERWAEPLADMVGRVVANNLSSRLTGTQVFQESGAISAVPNAILAIDILELDATDDGNLTLVATVAIETPNAPSSARVQRFTLSGRPASSDTAGMVAAMSDLLGKLADGIVDLLTAH